ncbi:hypothetical protein KIF59_12260 [Enterobacter cloacae subsp. cloacae]|nr:hypothetical protein [Enterobacter cloacae subsp. cloacae]
MNMWLAQTEIPASSCRDRPFLSALVVLMQGRRLSQNHQRQRNPQLRSWPARWRVRLRLTSRPLCVPKRRMTNASAVFASVNREQPYHGCRCLR